MVVLRNGSGGAKKKATAPSRAVEEAREVKDEHGRRGRGDYEELDRLFLEADRFLEGEDLCGANEALKKAGLKAASMWGEVGRPGHKGKLVGLLWQVHEDLSRPGQSSPGALRKDLRQLRSRFELEARRDARPAAGGRSPRREKR